MSQTLLVEDLHKRFGSGRRLVWANDGITMSVNAGEVVGLLGHNGAGKTTLVNQIVGLYRPYSGRIAVDGVDVVADPAAARRLVSVQAQENVPITGISPRKAVELVGRIRGGRRSAMRQRAKGLIDALDMGEWADRPAEKVSGGVARLSAFAMAVARPGALVVLDEPTNDVDPVRRQLLWDEVRRVADDGAAVLLVTHNVREAERAVDSLVLLDHGKILTKGTTASVVSEFGGGFRLDVDVARGAVPAFPDGWGVHRHDAAHWSVSVPEGGGVEAAEWATHARAAGLYAAHVDRWGDFDPRGYEKAAPETWAAEYREVKARYDAEDARREAEALETEAAPAAGTDPPEGGEAPEAGKVVNLADWQAQREREKEQAAKAKACEELSFLTGTVELMSDAQLVNLIRTVFSFPDREAAGPFLGRFLGIYFQRNHAAALGLLQELRASKA